MSFVEDWDAFLAMTGVENADIAYYMAQHPFDSDAHRDSIIRELSA